jgi:hypothetical protein
MYYFMTVLVTNISTRWDIWEGVYISVIYVVDESCACVFKIVIVSVASLSWLKDIGDGH